MDYFHQHCSVFTVYTEFAHFTFVSKNGGV